MDRMSPPQKNILKNSQKPVILMRLQQRGSYGCQMGICKDTFGHHSASLQKLMFLNNTLSFCEATPLGEKCEILWRPQTHLRLSESYPGIRGLGGRVTPFQVRVQVCPGTLIPSCCGTRESPLPFLVLAHILWAVLHTALLQKSEVLLKWKKSSCWLLDLRSWKWEFFITDRMVCSPIMRWSLEEEPSCRNVTKGNDCFYLFLLNAPPPKKLLSNQNN